MKKCLLLIALLFAIAASSYAKSAVFNILDYGAVGDGKTLTTASIQKAIDACAANGGGLVTVPKGEFLIGTLNLASNVEFHMETGATLIATTDLTQYQIHNEQPAGVFYTEKAHNVSITGNGTIFGQGMEMMYIDSPKVIGGKEYTRQKDNFRKLESGVGDGPFYAKDRYHQMIVFSECTDLTLKDFTVIDAPYWTFLIVHCDGVLVDGLRIDNNLMIPNSDGLDVISSSNVIIANCYFSCGDDAIVLAGYAHHFGDPGFKGILKRSENINVSNCILRSRSSAIRIGGWDQNHMANYNFSNIVIFDSNRGINLSVGDSGSVQNVNFTNIRIETRLHTGDWWGQGDPIKITAIRGVPNSPRIGIIKNINFTNVSCRSENCINMIASEETRLQNIFFNNLQMEFVKSEKEETIGGNLDLRPNIVPGKELFARDIPAIYVENADNVMFDKVDVSWDRNIDQKHYTNAIEAVGVNGLRLTNVRAEASPSNPQMSAVVLNNCRDFYTDSKLSVKKINEPKVKEMEKK
ncbi:MAG TPA: glycosyl hydrolase family 28 protein [Prolixibacteraceae bacterium]|nr:glycosyl hydrolase family 28 protein [Prolixibacteraceae bacterium]